jgi:hypothetical protein
MKSNFQRNTILNDKIRKKKSQLKKTESTRLTC